MSQEILCTFPGKFGDILWAMATVKEIARQNGAPVDFCLSNETKSLIPLLRLQPYIRSAWVEEADWVGDPGRGQQIVPGWEVVSRHQKPGCPYERYEKIHHLHYKGWPSSQLPIEILYSAEDNEALPDIVDKPFQPPWITLPEDLHPGQQENFVYLGWSEEWFELKLGLTHLLWDSEVRQRWADAQHAHIGTSSRIMDFRLTHMEGSRWQDAPIPSEIYRGERTEWIDAARSIVSCGLYVGCLSAQWVLANALGIPCVVVEPDPARHNPIFWWHGPIESDGLPRNTIVRGNDGKPTFDGRAAVAGVAAAIERWKELRACDRKPEPTGSS
jgi:hypothetical protein